jgi:hypothetical protein
MTPIFNGVADSGSLTGVDFYRVDIDHANDIVQHVGGQTVRGLTLFRIHPHPPTAHRPCIRDGCIVLTRSKRVPCA